jgi:hypothetical protein
LCEDFESGAIDGALWNRNEVGGATLNVDPSRFHRGRYALHCHTPTVSATATDLTAQLVDSSLFPGLKDGFYVRAWFYLPSPVATANETLFAQVRTSGGGALLALQAGHLQFYEFGTNPDHAAVSATAMPLDRWACLEWNVQAGTSRAWLDGIELADTRFSGASTEPIQNLSLGVSLFQARNHPATDAWVDDILVDVAPIGCDR